MSALGVCDSPAAAGVLKQRWPGILLCTDNPILADTARQAGSIRNIDALLDQRAAHDLGRQALSLTNAIDRQLASSSIPARYGLSAAHFYLTGGLSRLIASLFHRGAVLAAALAETGAHTIHIATHDCGRWEPRNPLLMPWFGHPARALGEAGFFGEHPWSYNAVDASLPKLINEAAADSIVRRAAVVPVGVVTHEIISQFFHSTGDASRNVFVGEINEALRETLPWLARQGIRPKPAASVRSTRTITAYGFEFTPEVDPAISALLREPCATAVNATGRFNAPQIGALCNLIEQHLSAGLTHLQRQTGVLRTQIKAAFPQGGVLLTNGLFGADGGQAYGLYAEQGVKVVEFEHGVTAGLAALTDKKIAENHPPEPALHLVCSETAATAFNGGNDADPTAVPIGLADSVRTIQHAPLQRWLARRSLGLAQRQPIVMHVSTLPYYGNVRPGLGTPGETVTYTIDRTLLTEVYAKLPHRTVFKQYPTQRFPYEPRYDEIFTLPSHVTVTKDEDFRYMRAAADVIVTMTPTSTLGWCVGAGVPIVWLASRLINPLSTEALHSEFAEAFPSVDLDRDDWPVRLRETLHDLAVLSTNWASKQPAREKLYRRSITGPSGSTGKRAAEIIGQFIRGENVH